MGPAGPVGPAGKNGTSILWLGTFASAPVSPHLDNAYYNSTTKRSYLWNGHSWQILAKDGSPGVAGPAGANGADGKSILWLGTRTSAPSSPALDNAYYNSTDKKSYVWDGSSWQVLAQDGAPGPQGPAGPAG
jgi:hypothetical protein